MNTTKFETVANDVTKAYSELVKTVNEKNAFIDEFGSKFGEAEIIVRDYNDCLTKIGNRISKGEEELETLLKDIMKDESVKVVDDNLWLHEFSFEEVA